MSITPTLSLASTSSSGAVVDGPSYRRVYTIMACLALVAWVVTSAMSIRSGRTVSMAYSQAAQHWIAGENLYEASGHGFLYLPHAAILYLPFALLPQPTGDVLWRLVNLAVFAIGVVRFTKLVPNLTPRTFALFAGVCLMMCVNVLRNGQATLAMTGLMLLACEAVASRAWTRAVCLLLLAVALKPLAIVTLLLVGALYAPLRKQLALGIVATALLPFAAQAPQYVAGQYGEFAVMLTHANRITVEDWWGWSQLFSMLRIVGIVIDPQVQTVLRGVAALAVLGLFAVAFRTCKPQLAAVYLFALSAVYLMLFNPKTENNTYCILGPALAAFLVQETLQRHWFRSGVLAALVVGCALSFEIGKYFTPTGLRPIWLAPLCCCLFTVYLLRELLRDVASSRAAASDKSATTEPAIRRAA